LYLDEGLQKMTVISDLYNITPNFKMGLLISAAVLCLWLGATAAYRLLLNLPLKAERT
jgi:hypothetical protein